MLYDMDCEPGHRECKEQVTYPDLAEYQPGSERLERLYEAMQQAQRFQQPSIYSENL